MLQWCVGLREGKVEMFGEIVIRVFRTGEGELSEEL